MLILFLSNIIILSRDTRFARFLQGRGKGLLFFHEVQEDILRIFRAARNKLDSPSGAVNTVSVTRFHA